MQRLKARDAEIDAGIDSISRGIDNLVNISSAMKDEVNFHISHFTRPLLSSFLQRYSDHHCKITIFTGEQPEPKAGEDRQQYAEDHREANGGQRAPALSAQVRPKTSHFSTSCVVSAKKKDAIFTFPFRVLPCMYG